MEDKIFICIDIKSFFASAECFLNNLDPLTHNVVVAEKDRGSNAMALAISLSMRKMGLKNRCRIYEIPKNIEYVVFNPRIEEYKKISKKIFSSFLEYVSEEDIHIYSIDECFIEITKYLKLYNIKAKEFAKTLQNMILKNFKMYSSVGIGTNIFLSKIALDILAKRNVEGIGVLNLERFNKYIKNYRPLNDIWGIGKGICEKLKKYNIYDLESLSKLDDKILKKELGINYIKIKERAKGYDYISIKELNTQNNYNKIYSKSRMFIEEIDFEKGFIKASEMLEILNLKAIENEYYIGGISLKVLYSKNIFPVINISKKLENRTNLYSKLFKELKKIYFNRIHKDLMIKQLGISVYNLKKEKNNQLDIFNSEQNNEKEEKMLKTMIEIKRKFGDESLVRLSNLKLNEKDKK